MRLLINFAAFQLGWFSCVLGAANGRPWLGPAIVVAVTMLHLILARRPGAELRLIMLAMALGLVFDSLLVASGWLSYPSGIWMNGFAPYWIIAMWALFATTLNVSMKWLRGRPAVAFLLGGVGGPLSYLAGEKLGAMSFLEPILALTALTVGWAIAMPLLSWLASHFDGVTQRRSVGFVHDDWRVSTNA